MATVADVRVERGSLVRAPNELTKSNDAADGSLYTATEEIIAQETVLSYDHRGSLSLAPSVTTLCDELQIGSFEYVHRSPSSHSHHRSTASADSIMESMDYVELQNGSFLSKANLSALKSKLEPIHAVPRPTTNDSDPAVTDNALDYHCKSYLHELLRSNLSFTKLVVLDWDDTLFPTTALPLQQLRAFDANPLFEGETKALYYTLKSLIDAIISLVDSIAADGGTVVIVTNAGMGWIDGIFGGHFSGVIARLFAKLKVTLDRHHIQIRSARDEFIRRHLSADSNGSDDREFDEFDGFDEFANFDGERAKTECFQHIFSEFMSETVHDEVPVVYCVGDGMDEFNASQRAWNEEIGKTYVSILERVKLLENPSIDLLVQEIETVQALIDEDSDRRFIEWILNENYVIDYV